MTYFCSGLGSVLELTEPLLPGLSPIFVVVHNLSASILSTKRDLLVGVPQRSVLGPLYLLHTAPISDVIPSCHFNYHLCADDFQLYLTFKADDVYSSSDCVVSCVSEISCWMEQNDLKLNPEKGHLSVKILAICQLSVYWLLIINHIF